MITDTELKEIKSKPLIYSASSDHIQNGIPIPKTSRIKLLSPNEWEVFVEEWASSLNISYAKVRRFGGAGDLGIDIAAFIGNGDFMDVWDNYQCKHYDHPLTPSDIWVEFGKIIYYSYKAEYKPPRKYYFVCPNGIGTKLERLLNNPNSLKNCVEENWQKYCENGITLTTKIHLSGGLKTFFDSFDFAIFSSKSAVELVEEHSKTSFHAVRFGGGLPQRPLVSEPPETFTSQESRYIRQIFDAYSEHIGTTISNVVDLEPYEKLKDDYKRQRVRFYHADALRNFARDTVPEGTFEKLQEEVYHGVVDVCEKNHANGFERMKATVIQAAQVGIISNPLTSSVNVQDKQGICHQLANDDRITWVVTNE